MTQKEKELLLVDLCGRLPYEVILIAPNGKVTYQTDGNTGAELLVEEGFKPVLRPMSDMTEEEYKELKSVCPYYGFAPYEYIGDWCPNYEMVDWCNKNHFDYRGLIGKGLAIAVTEDRNPYK